MFGTIFDFFVNIFDAQDAPRRWNCGILWEQHPEVGWVHIVSDLATFAAYMVIPFALAYFILRRRDMPFPKIFWLFAAFIFACGTVHLIEAIIFWLPVYRLSALVKLITGFVSCITVVVLIPLIPRMLALKSPDELEREIAEREKAEEQTREHQRTLSHVSRLSTMGEMVAGIAHEINQPLFSIRNFSLACTNVLQPEDANEIPTALEFLEQIEKQSMRAAEIMKRLADFVRHEKPRRSMVDVNAIINDAIEMAAFEAGRWNVKVNRKLQEPSRRIFADVVQIQQVLVNLLHNAFEALQVNDARDRHVIVRTLSDGNEVEIEVADNGPGFSDEIAGNLFETFFSTKDQGMGMGLAIARSITTEHRGSLRAYRNQDGGATFVIRLLVEGEQLNAGGANSFHSG